MEMLLDFVMLDTLILSRGRRRRVYLNVSLAIGPMVSPNAFPLKSRWGHSKKSNNLAGEQSYRNTHEKHSNAGIFDRFDAARKHLDVCYCCACNGQFTFITSAVAYTCPGPNLRFLCRPRFQLLHIAQPYREEGPYQPK